MSVVTMEVGELGACCYIVGPDNPATPDGGVPCVVIDPGAEAGRITEKIKKLGLRAETILLTHAHADHIGGVEGMLQLWPGAVLACSAETSRRAADATLNLSAYIGVPITAPAAGRILADGETLTLAGMEWKAIEVPGHEPGEMVFILGDGHAVFTGDTVFAGSVGRSDFPGGDHMALISGVRKLLESLPPDAVLYPGHGPATKAGVELRHNPFL